MFEGVENSDLQKAFSLSEQVYSSHLPGYTLGRGNTKSPFRVDKIPSFQVKWLNGKWKFVDYGDSEKKGDVIDFIEKAFSYLPDSVKKAINDFITELIKKLLKELF